MTLDPIGSFENVIGEDSIFYIEYDSNLPINDKSRPTGFNFFSNI